jgi:hypothetical protein
MTALRPVLLLALAGLAASVAPARADDSAEAVALRFYGAGRRPAPPPPTHTEAPTWIAPDPGPGLPVTRAQPPPGPGGPGGAFFQPPAPDADPVPTPEEPAGPPPQAFPGYAPEQAPASFQVSRRTILLKARPRVRQYDVEHRLAIRPLDQTLRRYRLWLDPQVELRGVETPWGTPQVARAGAALDIELPYAPYREEFEVRLRTRHATGPRRVHSLPAEVPWSPAPGGPEPPTELAVRVPHTWAPLVNGSPAGVDPREDGAVHRFVTRGATTPGVSVGPWTPLRGPRVDFLVPGRPSANDQALADFLERTAVLAAEAMGKPETWRLAVVLKPARGTVPQASGRLVLDPRDETWTESWDELARRALRAAWPVPVEEGSWLDEAVPAYLAVIAAAQDGPPRWPEEPHVGVRLGPRPGRGWDRSTQRWARDSRRRGVPVLRALRAALGQEGFRDLLRELAARGPAPGTTEALQELVAGHDLDGFLRGVVSRGEAMDLRVEEILASDARRRGDFQGDVYHTRIRFRMSRGASFRGPVPVVIETDFGVLKRMLDWTKPDQELDLWTRSRVRRAIIDPERWYPDPNRSNNTLEFRGTYRMAGRSQLRGAG